MTFACLLRVNLINIDPPFLPADMEAQANKDVLFLMFLFFPMDSGVFFFFYKALHHPGHFDVSGK